MSDTLKSIDHVQRTPGPAIWVGGILSIIATLYGGAFLVLSTGCAVFLYLSYLMPIVFALRSELAGTWKNKGPFNLGGASVLVAILAIIGCAVLIFVGVQPPQEKVGYLIVLMILALIALWQSMEGRMPIGLLFAALTAAAVYYFWHVAGDSFGLIAAVVVAVVMAILVFLVQSKRFAGPPVGAEIAKRQAAIAAAEKAMAS